MTTDHDTAIEIPPARQVSDTFFRLYEDRFDDDFRRAFRDVTLQDDDDGIALDPKALYRALFLPGEIADAGDTLRASFRALAEATEEAEAILKRTWMIMATNFIDYRLKNGGDPEDVNALQDMLEEYSTLLNDVYLDMSRSIELEIPKINRVNEEYRQVVDTFREYMLTDFPEEVGERLRIFTCFRGVPVDSPAEVVSVDALDVTFRVSPTQAAILGRMGLALVESPLHGLAFRAYSSHVHVPACEVTFSHFVSHDEPIERRKHDRVRPERPVEATIIKNDSEITGMLLDVSAVAAAVYLRNVDISMLSEGDEVKLNVVLPRFSSAGEFEMCIPGRLGIIDSGFEDDPKAHRIIVEMPGDAKIFDQICRYIAEQQSQNLRASAGAEPAD